jgi:putative oxygen-independent coproporphyrinogen III oxidase
VIERAVYIHWPFCESKCPYCDFNSHVRETVDHDRWREALCREVRWWGERAPDGPITSVFLGGGTPSLMAPGTTSAVLAEIDRCFCLADDCEITLEANPSSVEAGRFRDFRAAGVNRLSLGVQSFDDDTLRFLGRAHDASQALAAIDTARTVFDRFSFDLIYALPDQTEAEWGNALARAIDLSAGHLSLYQLTIEPNTGFAGAVKRGAWQPMDDDRAADFFDHTQEVCSIAGLPAYETSNHAALGHESRHNLAYWQYGSWIGIGPGAHGRPLLADGHRAATANWKKPERWLESVEAVGHGCEEDDFLSTSEQAEEALMMGLRLSEGLGAAAFRERTGVSIVDAVDGDACARLADLGLIDCRNEGIAVTSAGRLLLNSITRDLLAGRGKA